MADAINEFTWCTSANVVSCHARKHGWNPSATRLFQRSGKNSSPASTSEPSLINAFLVRQLGCLFIPIWNGSRDPPFVDQSEMRSMSTNARLLTVGVMTSVIVAVGFASSLLAQSRIKPPIGYQSPVGSQQLTPVRVILPASAEPAHPPQPSTVSPPEPGAQAQAVKPATSSVRLVEKAEAIKPADAERREQRRRYPEGKSRMIAAREQMERRPGPGIMAFGDDEPRRTGFPGN
jgi:hypothetical protein